MSDVTQPRSILENTGKGKSVPESSNRLDKPAAILFVGSLDDKDIKFDTKTYEVVSIADPGRAMEMLHKERYDLFILDDTVFENETTGAVSEIKRRNPLIPVLVLSNNTETAYQTDLMEAGADDILAYSLSGEELHRRLDLMLKLHRQNRSFSRRNQNLHAITRISRRLHSATDPYNLIVDTVDLTCRTFGLYGVAIVLDEGDKLRLYAGGEGNNRPYDSIIQTQRYDPFHRAMNTGIMQIFQDITNDYHYTSIPVLPKARSAIIVPLKYQDYTIGALGVFQPLAGVFNHEDLVIYELFAAQFVVALQNVRHYETQYIKGETTQHLLRAWQRFITLNSFDEIAHSLREMVEGMAIVGSALVWLYPEREGNGAEMILSCENADTIMIFKDLHDKGQVRKIVDQFDDRMQPLHLWLGRGHQNPLGPLFRALRGQQLTILPITDSLRLIGGVIASAENNNQFGIEDINLMESLVHAAGQAIERITLIAGIQAQTGRLEAILRSIHEGIFFVDENDNVAFCNPQLTELTGIKPSEALNHEPKVLLELLANRALDKGKALSQLREAVSSVLDPDDRSRDYPIVEINLTEPEIGIYIEFVRMGTLSQSVSWAGIVRDNTRFTTTTMTGDTQSVLLEAIGEHVRVPYSQIRSTIATVAEKHNTYTPKERERLLRQVERGVEHVGQLLDNFLQAYNLQTSSLVMNPEDANLADVVNRVLNTRPFNLARRQIQVDSPARVPMVNIDEFYIGQVIANILQNALQYSPPGAPIELRLYSQGQEVLFSVRDQGMGIPSDELTHIFEPFHRASNNPAEHGAGLGLYLAQELVQRHGGRIWAESAPGRGTVMTIALPAADVGQPSYANSGAFPADMPTYAREEAIRSGVRVPDRAPQTVMIVEGRSRIVSFLRKKLEAQGYELLNYRSGDDALRDLSLRRLDLILLDTDLLHEDGLDICERIRRHSEVPIILMADEVSEPDKVRGFKVGADDYLARPMSEDELVARIKAIFKRQQIPDRTRKPLDLGELYIDFSRREVFLSKKPVELTRIEYDLLHTLAVNIGVVLTHRQLLEKVWGPEYQGETQYLWVNVSRLRKKLEPTPTSPRYIHNQAGIGYVFRNP